MKIAVVGSRGYRDLAAVRRYVTGLPRGTVIVSGGARGVDTIAETTAKEARMQTEIILPDWGNLGRSAGFKRNVQIVDACDELVAFWDGSSKGTKHSIDLAKKAGKKVTIFRMEKA